MVFFMSKALAKARVLAGMIRYGIRKGMISIFVTEKT
jgi:hypothetical protein